MFLGGRIESGFSGKEVYRSGKLLSLKEANLGKTCFLGQNPITFDSTFGVKLNQNSIDIKENTLIDLTIKLL